MGLFLFTSCETTAPCENETNGFGPFEGQTVYLGSQETVDVFTAIDAAWAARDYETLKSFIVDGGNFSFADGTVVSTGDDFVAHIDAEYQEAIEKMKYNMIKNCSSYNFLLQQMVTAKLLLIE